MRKNGIEKACEVCGKMIYVQPNQIERGEGKYCSYACSRVGKTGKELKPGGCTERYTRKDGYVFVRVGIRKWALEHRVVMEAHLGRRLAPNEQVHHKDQNRANNELSNLEVVPSTRHQSYHPQLRRWETVICQECGKPFEAKPSRAHAKDPKNQRKYCSLECRYKAWGRKMHPSKEK